MAVIARLFRRIFGDRGGHGGIRGFVWPMYKENDRKRGNLVGVDKYGNKYYEERKRNFFGRHRWVVYTSEMNGKNTHWDADASMVPAEWHGWLHSITDHPPTTHPPESRPFLAEVHQFNMSATPQQYVPYPTTRKKIQEWVPPKA